MVPFLGDFPEDATVYMPFNTFTSDDPAASATITNLADADIKVHKDGSTTEITTDGATVAIDFDSITGNHLITIDTSADAAYTTGSDYLVRIEGTTVDGGTVNAWVGHFSIQNRYSAGALRPTTAGRTLDVTAGGAAGIDWGNVENQSTAVDLSATDIQLADTVTTVTNDVGVNEWNGVALATTNPLPNAAPDAAGGLPISDAGGLDLDGVLSGNVPQTGDSFARIGATGSGLTTLATAAALATAQSDLDILTGSDGVTLATAQANYAPAQAGDAMTLANGAVTNASLAGNMEIVFETDFATNYNTTRNAWATNVQDTVGTGSFGLNDIAATDIVTGGAITTSGGAVSNVTLVATTTTNTDMRGTDGANTTTPPTAAAIRSEMDSNSTKLASIETDTQDIQGRLPAALVGGRMDANVGAISGSTTAADNLEQGALAVPNYAVNDASATTTSFVTTLTETTDDHYNGRVITFTSGALAEQSTDVTDYDGSTKTLTVTALTEAPANGTTFVFG